MKLIKSNIYNNGKYYKYLGIIKGRVVYLDNTKPKDYSIIEDFSKYYIYPGFIDSHTHFMYHGLNLLRPCLTNAKSEDDIYDIVMEYYKKNKNVKFIIAEGFDESKFYKKTLKTDKLKNILPNVSVIIRRICGHIAIVNKKAAELMLPYGGIYDKHSGVYKEGAVLKLYEIFHYDSDYRKKAFLLATKDMLSYGITSIGDFFTQDMTDIYNNAESIIDHYKYIIFDNNIDFDKIKDIKGIKVFLDGSIGGRTAAFSKNYKYRKNRGNLIHSKRTLLKIKKIARKYNLQLSFHAIGDRAIEQAIDILDSGDRIEHFEFPKLKHIYRVKQKNIFLSMQPNFVANWGGVNNMYYKYVPKCFYKLNNPFKIIIDNNIKLGFGSDDMPLSPFYALIGAIKAPNQNQKISLSKAFDIYTRGSSDIMNIEAGTLELLKKADFFIIKEKLDILKKGKIPIVLYTYKNGKRVYSRG